MTALSASHGSKADFYIGTSGTPAIAIAISQYLDTTALGMTRDKAETSAFKQLFKSYVAGLIDLVIPLQGPADVNISTQMYGLFTMSGAGNAIAWQYGPTGIGAGLGALYTGVGFVTKFEEKSALNSAYAWTGEFQNSGTPVRTIQ